MQKVTWFGAGRGTSEDPFVLVNTASFNGTEPFSIQIQNGTNVDTNRITRVKFSTYMPNKIFTLAMIYSNTSPINPFIERDAVDKSGFNGNNNLGTLDGPYYLLNYNGKDYMTKLQIFSEGSGGGGSISPEDVMEIVKPYLIKEIRETDTVIGQLEEHEEGKDLILNVKVVEDDTLLEVTPEGIETSKEKLNKVIFDETLDLRQALTWYEEDGILRAKLCWNGTCETYSIEELEELLCWDDMCEHIGKEALLEKLEWR